MSYILKNRGDDDENDDDGGGDDDDIKYLIYIAS
jgi:hypothetical protein